MNKKILAIALCVCSANFAIAESVEPRDTSRAKAMTGLVLGVQAGFAAGFNPPDEISVLNASYSVTNGGFNFGGLVGYDFAINDMFSIGAEVDVNYSPDMYKQTYSDATNNADIKINVLNIPIMLTGKFVTPVGVNLFVKGGLNYQRADVSASCSGPIAVACQGTDSNNAWTGVLAGGVGYQMNEINIFAQYMYIFGQDLQNLEDNKAVEQGIITGGITYTLPM